MLNPFQLARTPIIHFGAGKADLIPGLVSNFGRSVLLVTGKRSFVTSAHFGRLTDSFCSNGIDCHLITVAGEPSPETVDETVLRYKDIRVDVVVSIGGGSVIDAGKAISAMLGKNDSVRNYLEGIGNKEHPGTKVPFIAVPTTSGTGSEATKNAVISQPGLNGFKKSLRHDTLVPDIAIVDPALTLDCPKDITAASGMDCFTQITEAYLSDKANEITDAYAYEGLKAVRRSLLDTFYRGEEISPRSDMSFAALVSGICLANAGLGAVHGLAGTIGGMYNIPHGVICGSLMSAANEVNVRELRKINPYATALKKYAFLGRLFLDERGRPDDYYIDGFVEHLYSLTEELHLPGLMMYGLGSDNVSKICAASEIKNNPVKLSKYDLEEIIVRRL